MSGVFEPTFIGVNKSDTLYTLRRWKQYNARNWEGEGGDPQPQLSSVPDQNPYDMT